MTTEPAFPNDINRYGDLPQYTGITIRDYFAAAALTGLMSIREVLIAVSETDGKHNVATAACAIADAMITAREPKPDVAGLENYKRETALLA